jgi:hypothetical protein
MSAGRPSRCPTIGRTELQLIERLLADAATSSIVRKRATILIDCCSGLERAAVADKHGVSAAAVAKVVTGFLRDRVRYLCSRPGRPHVIVPGSVLLDDISARTAARRAGLSPSTVSRARRNAGTKFRANGTPEIEDVRFGWRRNQIAVSIAGSGFGAFPFRLPWRGTSRYLRIANNAQLGFGEYGYAGDYWRLTYQKWSDSEIRFDGFYGQRGDSLVLAVWNPQTMAGTSWGGNLPGGRTRPHIERVRFFPSAENCGLEISGKGFGPSPFVGRADTVDFLCFTDWRTPGLSSSSYFEAGFSGFRINKPSHWTLRYESWCDERIMISSLADPEGLDLEDSLLNLRDPLSISLWSSRSTDCQGPQTAWAGRFRFSR